MLTFRAISVSFVDWMKQRSGFLKLFLASSIQEVAVCLFIFWSYFVAHANANTPVVPTKARPLVIAPNLARYQTKRIASKYHRDSKDVPERITSLLMTRFIV